MENISKVSRFNRKAEVDNNKFGGLFWGVCVIIGSLIFSGGMAFVMENYVIVSSVP